jgi:hypothetical protein
MDIYLRYSTEEQVQEISRNAIELPSFGKETNWPGCQAASPLLLNGAVLQCQAAKFLKKIPVTRISRWL